MIGSRIAVLRKQKGLSQAELSNLLNVSQSAVGMYEQGRREPPAQMLVLLSQQLGVSVDFLLTGNAQPTNRAELKELAGSVQKSNTILGSMGAFSRNDLILLIAAKLFASE